MALPLAAPTPPPAELFEHTVDGVAGPGVADATRAARHRHDVAAELQRGLAGAPVAALPRASARAAADEDKLLALERSDAAVDLLLGLCGYLQLAGDAAPAAAWADAATAAAARACLARLAEDNAAFISSDARYGGRRRVLGAARTK